METRHWPGQNRTVKKLNYCPLIWFWGRFVSLEKWEAWWQWAWWMSAPLPSNICGWLFFVSLHFLGIVEHFQKERFDFSCDGSIVHRKVLTVFLTSWDLFPHCHLLRLVLMCSENLAQQRRSWRRGKHLETSPSFVRAKSSGGAWSQCLAKTILN